MDGTVTRIDRPASTSGYLADEIVPVRHAIIEIRESDDIFDDSYGETTTDDDGYYSFSFCDDDGLNSTLELYLQLTAEIRVNGHYVVNVQDISWLDEIYRYETDIWESDGGHTTANVELTRGQSAIFNMAEAVLDAWTFWNASGGAPGEDSIFDPEAEVLYEPGWGYDNSFFDRY
ncbi:MAG: hypothetical protein EHM70_22915, partial [Chloroflexota bacterium]